MWASSKSNSVTAQEKLAEAYRKLKELGDTFDYIPDYVQTCTRDPEWMAEEDDFV